MDSVVSIAVSTASFDPDEGFRDVSNKIGSGFVVDASGLIITNQHVVSDTRAEYVVVTNDGEEYAVVDVQRDDVNDIALIKVKLEKDKKLVSLKLGDSEI
jgi:serine protease Do